MGKIIRQVYYFDEPGGQNTKDVIEVVTRCIEETGIKYLIVASTSGKTALKFAETLKDKDIKTFCISEPPSRQIWGEPWPIINEETRKIRRVKSYHY